MPDPDTSIGGDQRRFDTTQWSRVLDVQAGDGDARRRALEDLIARYWKPVYYYLRLQWKRSNEESKDLTQAFFASLIDGDALGRIKKERGRFRSFLRGALRNFVTNASEAERAIKRGGGRTIVGLEALRQADLDPASASQGPTAAMDREWKRVVMSRALERLREIYAGLGKEKVYEVFKACTFDADVGSTQMEVADHHGLSPVDLKNYLADARRRFRQGVSDLVAETVSDGETLRQEMRELFGEAMLS